MLRLLFLPICFLLLLGCGNVKINGALQTSSISGEISTVQLSSASGMNGVSQITVVIFLNNSSSTTVNFCGNIVNQMPLGSFATVGFTQNQGCATLTFIA
ncbi:MAG TPA: hypothetical protein VK657_01335, partial [Terriglobales bacterium]|nr:hypothetical protein [Terriglobales bacterium]